MKCLYNGICTKRLHYRWLRQRINIRKMFGTISSYVCAAVVIGYACIINSLKEPPTPFDNVMWWHYDHRNTLTWWVCCHYLTNGMNVYYMLLVLYAFIIHDLHICLGCQRSTVSSVNWKHPHCRPMAENMKAIKNMLIVVSIFTPQPLRAPGYCRTPSGRAGGRQGRQAPLTLSRP